MILSNWKGSSMLTEVISPILCDEDIITFHEKD